MRSINLIMITVLWLLLGMVPVHISADPIRNGLPMDGKTDKLHQTGSVTPFSQILQVVWGDNNKIAVVYMGQAQFRVKILDSSGHMTSTFDIDNSSLSIGYPFVWGVKPYTSNLLAVPGQSVAIFDSNTGKIVQYLEDTPGPDDEEGLSWAPDKRIAAAKGGEIHVWNADTGALLTRIGIGGADNERVTSVAWRPNHPDELAGSLELSGVGIWNVQTGTLIRKLPVTLATDSDGNPLAVVGNVAWSPDGNQLAASTAQGVIIWNAQTSTQHVIPRFGGNLLWSPDGKRLMTGGGTTILSVDLSTEKVSTLVVRSDRL